MKAVLVLSFVLIIAVACGSEADIAPGKPTDIGGATSSPTTTASPSPTEEQVDFTSEQLVDALLSVSDLPTGWTTAAPEEEESDQDYCGSDKEDFAVPFAETKANFQQSETGPFLLQELSVYEDDGAELVAEGFRSLPQTCAAWTETDEEGTETEWTLTELSFPKIGDETAAVRLASEATFLGIVEIDAILMRRGNTVNLIYYGVIGFEGIDSQQTEEFASLADQKLRAAD